MVRAGLPTTFPANASFDDEHAHDPNPLRIIAEE